MATPRQKFNVFLFMVLTVGAMVSFVFFVSGYRAGARVPYYIEFEESVLGLGVGSVVEYMGVPVGSVDNIWVTPNNKVHVDLFVDLTKVDLREGVTASLAISSLATGALNISLEGGSPDARRLQAGGLIPTKKSFQETVRVTGQELVQQMGEIVEMIKSSLEGMESGQIASVVANANRITENGVELVGTANDTILEVQGEFSEGMDEIKVLAQKVGEVADNINEFVNLASSQLEAMDLAAISENLNTITENVVVFTERLTDTVATLKETSESLVHEADNVEYSLRVSLGAAVETFESIQELADFIKENPSALLRGRRVQEEEQ